MDIKDRFEKLKTDYNIKLGEQKRIERELDKALKLKKEKEELAQSLNKLQVLLEATSSEARQKAINNIEAIVTNALQFIFEKDMKFKIDLKQLRGKPSCEVYVETEVNGVISRQRPEDSTGGGIVDAIATAMRYAYISAFSEPALNNAMMLDEPGKMVSANASVNFSNFIKELGKMFDRQTIVVTHNDSIMSIADKTYLVEKPLDESVVREGVDYTDEDPF